MSQERSQFETLLVERIRKLKPQVVNGVLAASSAEQEAIRSAVFDGLAFSLIGEELQEPLPIDPVRFPKGRILDGADLRYLRDRRGLGKLPLAPKARARLDEACRQLGSIDRLYSDRTELRADAAIAAWTKDEGPLLALLADETVGQRIVDMLAGDVSPPTGLGPLPREL